MALHYYPFIEKFLKARKLRENLPGVSYDSSFGRPFITIAREPGSGGAPIAAEVAKKLGFELVDQQIIDDIAKSTKKRAQVIRAVDERYRPLINDMVHSLLNTEYVNDVRYMRALTRVVLTYAHQGNVVILGRGTNFITPFAQGLHVDIRAPYDVRVHRAMVYEGHTKEKAEKVIADVTKERRDFIKQFLRKDADEITQYDLIINTACLSVQQASDIIVSSFKTKFG